MREKEIAVIYDLIVVGNGIAAQTFLFELFNSQKFASADVNNSQNYSVAQVFSDEISPPCSLKTTSTVALSGIEEDVSPLGNELRSSYFLFEEFVKKHSPIGVRPVVQSIVFTNSVDEAKLIRRYKKLTELNDPLLNGVRMGVQTHAFHITPEELRAWFVDFLNGQSSLKRISQFVRSIEKNEQGNVVCHLLNGENIVAKKIVLATGSYSKIFSHFFHIEELPEQMQETEILAGSYLERTVDFNLPSFLISVDGHKCVYRADEKKLVIGSVSENGAFITADLASLEKIISLFNENLSFNIGALSEFKVQTGLRHKGKKRRPIFRAIDAEKKVFMISGMYKNGFTFSHMAAKEILSHLQVSL
jgi:hypothetical protein